MDNEAFQRAVDAVRNDPAIDAWLLYDFRGNNEYLWQLVGKSASTTRRCFLLIPKDSPPTAVVHFVDKPQFTTPPGVQVRYYSTWGEFDSLLAEHLSNRRRIALEYSPNGELPTVSMVDGGFIDRVRELGITPVSSADLFQRTLATWTAQGRESHNQAVSVLTEALNSALDLVKTKCSNGQSISEYDVQQHIVKIFNDHGLETDDPPIVAVDEHSSDPHYMPTERVSNLIKPGQWLLIDLWGRIPGEENIYGDITWVAYVGDQLSPEHEKTFNSVAKARDAVVTALSESWASGQFDWKGWQLDDIARKVLEDAGYGKCIRHRTGHSIGPGKYLHALGVNLDNYETHDTRSVNAGIGFSVEPGVYLPEFGVRSEIDVYIDPKSGPIVTTPLQQTVDLLLA